MKKTLLLTIPLLLSGCAGTTNKHDALYEYIKKEYCEHSMAYLITEMKSNFENNKELDHYTYYYKIEKFYSNTIWTELCLKRPKESYRTITYSDFCYHG